MDKSAYVTSAYEIIKSQSSTDELISASRVGLLLRGAHGGPRWEEHGFKALKYLLREMEVRGLLRFGETSHGALAIQLDDSKNPALDPAIVSSSNLGMSNQLLRSEIWRAFVMEEPKGKRFLKMESGQVLTGLQESPSPIDDWIELIPISGEIQRSWAKQYLSEQKLVSNLAILDSLEPFDWYRTFPAALGEHSPSLVSDWNRRRSNLVAQQVRQWCDEHNLRYEIAFRDRIHKGHLSSSPSLRGFNAEWDEESFRSIVVDALKCAPIDWLLDLPIPSKYIFRALMKQSGGS